LEEGVHVVAPVARVVLTRREADDQRDSIAVPIWAGNEVIAAVNLTWIHKVATVEQIVKTCLPHLTQATREISIKLETA
jgi:IclR family mhp operon transcriptional activator